MRYEGIRSLPGVGAAALGPALERVIRGVLCIYIIALPFQRLFFVERNGFILLLFLLVLWSAANRTHFFQRTPIDLPLAAFVGWVGLSIPFATFPAYSVQEFGKLLQQVLLFYAVLYFFNTEPYRRRLLLALIVVSMIISAYGIEEFFGMAGLLPAFKQMRMIESFTPGEVWLTTYLVMIIPICLAFMKLCFVSGQAGPVGRGPPNTALSPYRKRRRARRLFWMEASPAGPGRTGAFCFQTSQWASVKSASATCRGR